VEQRPDVRAAEPPRPVVGVHAPARPDVPDDHRQPGRRLDDRQPRGRTRLALAAVLALCAGGLVLADRTTGPSGVVDLALDPDPAVYLGLSRGGEDPSAVHLQVPVRVVNNGPRPVTVRSAAVHGGPLATTGPADVVVAAAGSAQVLLEQDVRCPAGGPPDTPRTGDRLVLQVATQAGARVARLRLPAEPGRSVDVELRQLCGYVPVREALRVTSRAGRLQPATAATAASLVVPVRLANSTIRPVRLTGLRPALPGLRVQLRNADGTARPLPLELPADPSPHPLPPASRPAGTELLLSFSLDDDGCAALRSAARPRSPAVPGTLALLQVDYGEAADGGQVHPPDDGLALPMLAALCL